MPVPEAMRLFPGALSGGVACGARRALLGLSCWGEREAMRELLLGGAWGAEVIRALVLECRRGAEVAARRLLMDSWDELVICSRCSSLFCWICCIIWNTRACCSCREGREEPSGEGQRAQEEVTPNAKEPGARAACSTPGTATGSAEKVPFLIYLQVERGAACEVH